MRILYILGAYKPRPSANGLCSDNIIQEFVDSGHSVTVLCNKCYDTKQFEIASNGIEIYRVKQRLFLRLEEWRAININAHPLKSKIVSVIAHIINKVQLLVMSPFWPKVSIGANRRFKKAALQLQEQKKFDVVISVYTPIESLMAGYKIKKSFPTVKFYPYFLDSLSGGYGPKCFSAKTTMLRGLKIEKKIFQYADQVILMKSSEIHYLKYNSSIMSKIVFLDIPMLKKTERNYSRNQNENTKILFVGSIAKSIRNPQTFVDALVKIKNDNIICEFVGNIDCIDIFEPLSERMGDRLIFTGFMSHDKLQEKIDSADILLNIGNLIPTMVPSKIFEYMSYGKPIISTFDIENEPSKTYLEKYPTALLLNGQDDGAANAEKINQFIETTKNCPVSFDSLEDIFYLNTPKAFVECIEKHTESAQT